MGLVIGIFGLLIAGGLFFFLMPLALRVLSHFLKLPQISYKQGIKLSFGFLCLGPLVIVVLQLIYFIMGGSFPSSVISTDPFHSALLIVIPIATFFLGMALFIHQELNEPFIKAMRIAPIFLVAMGLVFIVLFYAFSMLFARLWVG